MAHPYDTGLSLPQRTTLRNAVVARLTPLLKANGGYLATAKKLPEACGGAHDEETLGEIARVLQGQAPAVLIALGEEKYAAAGMPQTRKLSTIELYVYVGSVNGRDLVDGRLENDVVAAADDTKDPGIDTMLENVRQLLHAQDLGPETIYEPDIVHAKLVRTGPDFTIWEQLYHVEMDVVITPLARNAEAPQPVVGIDTNNYQPDADAPIPNPANPFLVTHTELDPP